MATKNDRPKPSVHYAREMSMYRRALNFALTVGIVLTMAYNATAQTASQPSPEKGKNRIPYQLSVFSQDHAVDFLPKNVGGPNAIYTPKMVELLKKAIRDYVPPTYVDEREWNKRRNAWDGVHIKFQDGKLHTRRKEKLVRSGSWNRYALSMVDPDKNLHIQFDRLEPTEDGKVAFEVTVDARLDCYGQVSEWLHDAKLFSASARATADVRLTLSGTVQFVVGFSKLLPEVTVKPHIDYAHLVLERYHLRRFSHIGGDAAKFLGDSMHLFVDELIDQENKRLAARINRKIARRQKKMTFSTHQWLEKNLPMSKPKS